MYYQPNSPSLYESLDWLRTNKVIDSLNIYIISQNYTWTWDRYKEDSDLVTRIEIGKKSAILRVNHPGIFQSYIDNSISSVESEYQEITITLWTKVGDNYHGQVLEDCSITSMDKSGFTFLYGNVPYEDRKEANTIVKYNRFARIIKELK